MTTDLDYIARCPECKHAVYWASHHAAGEKSVIRDIAKMMRDGLSIERITTDDARKQKFGHQPTCSIGIRSMPKARRKKAAATAPTMFNTMSS